MRDNIILIILDTIDATELAERVAYFMEQLDALDESKLEKYFAGRGPYALDDLRAGVVRLISPLQTNPIWPRDEP